MELKDRIKNGAGGKRKSIGINIPDDMHAEIKMAALRRGYTLKEYVIIAILEWMKKESIK